ncbi:MAG TPA: D-alanyl-D-alanine carboxypeptidase, partial [Clostridiales bacterium]|nr:D-alanyl-D-alanine carboxypeptidase [Clostridiales bacterium]
MKRFLIVISVLISAILISFSGVSALADGEVNTLSRSTFLMDAGSGTVIYSKNEKDRLPIASMTKIMLLNLCFEKFDEGVFSFDDEITVSKTASGMGGSQVFLEENGKYKAKDLIKSIIVASANDASVAMAEFLYGSEQKCVEAMNAKCAEWGLSDTLFSNCTGLTKPTQYSCAEDVAKMFGKLIKHKEYFDFSKIWTDEIEHSGGRVTGISNTNKLVRFYEGCDGGKTGYTSESGHCVAVTAKRGGLRL